MDNHKNFSEQESLLLIEGMINKAKNHFSENGHLYLLWGWVVFFCSLGHFILLRSGFEKHYLIWMLTWAAVIYQMIYLAKRKKKEKVKTYTDNIMGFVWLTFVITMCLMAFILSKGNADGYYKLINPMFLALYGIPTFLSGIILRFKPLISGGIGCWALSVFSNFIGYDYQLLLLSTAMIVAWIVPGYILRAKFKKENY